MQLLCDVQLNIFPKRQLKLNNKTIQSARTEFSAEDTEFIHHLFLPTNL